MIANLGDPFEPLFQLQRDLERRLTSGWLGEATSATGAFPPINIFQRGHDFVALVELPGVDKTTLDVEAKENAIRISGKKVIDYGDLASVHRRERVAGTFDRTITVPIRIDPAGMKAEYRDGILALFIARAEDDKPRAIKIS
jgi:HSP20 family protein